MRAAVSAMSARIDRCISSSRGLDSFTSEF
jgi:hypothetical protein